MCARERETKSQKEGARRTVVHVKGFFFHKRGGFRAEEKQKAFAGPFLTPSLIDQLANMLC